MMLFQHKCETFPYPYAWIYYEGGGAKQSTWIYCSWVKARFAASLQHLPTVSSVSVTALGTQDCYMPLICKALLDIGIAPGIKVVAGTTDMAGHPIEKIAEGLNGLRSCLAEYFRMGTRFAKRRAVIAVDV